MTINKQKIIITWEHGVIVVRTVDWPQVQGVPPKCPKFPEKPPVLPE